MTAITHCCKIQDTTTRCSPSCRNTELVTQKPKRKGHRESTRTGLQMCGNRIEPPHHQINLRSSSSHTKLSQLTLSLSHSLTQLRRTSHESTTTAAGAFGEPQSPLVHRHFLHAMQCNRMEWNARLLIGSLRTGAMRVRAWRLFRVLGGARSDNKGYGGVEMAYK